MQEELSADYLKFRARQTISNLGSSLSTYGQKWLCDRIGEKSRGNQKPKRATQVILSEEERAALEQVTKRHKRGEVVRVRSTSPRLCPR